MILELCGAEISERGMQPAGVVDLIGEAGNPFMSDHGNGPIESF